MSKKDERSVTLSGAMCDEYHGNLEDLKAIREVVGRTCLARDFDDSPGCGKQNPTRGMNEIKAILGESEPSKHEGGCSFDRTDKDGYWACRCGKKEGCFCYMRGWLKPGEHSSNCSKFEGDSSSREEDEETYTITITSPTHHSVQWYDARAMRELKKRLAAPEEKVTLTKKDPTPSLEEKPVKVVELEQTCAAFPAQWEGKTDDGRFVYIRYRHDQFTAAVDKDEERAILGSAEIEINKHLPNDDAELKLARVKELLPAWLFPGHSQKPFKLKRMISDRSDLQWANANFEAIEDWINNHED